MENYIKKSKNTPKTEEKDGFLLKILKKANQKVANANQKALDLQLKIDPCGQKPVQKSKVKPKFWQFWKKNTKKNQKK